jgi:hypothetical protein
VGIDTAWDAVLIAASTRAEQSGAGLKRFIEAVSRESAGHGSPVAPSRRGRKIDREEGGRGR